jgi:signal transduction histidine kinase
MRAKLIVAGAGASIAALSVVAIVAFLIAKEAISDSVMNGLTAVSTNQRQQIESMFAHYKVDLKKVSGDTQITQSLRHFVATRDPVDRLVMNQILVDRLDGDSDDEYFDIHDTKGSIVASSDPGHIGPSSYNSMLDGILISVGPVDTSDGVMSVRMSEPIVFDGRTIGYVTVQHSGEELNDIATGYLGRRETGETLIVSRDSGGNIRYITSLRFNENGDFYRSIKEPEVNRIESLALTGYHGSGTDLIDYRGERVFGVYHFIESANIGLAVKIDEAEALSPLIGLGRGLIIAIVIVSMAIISAAFVIARYLVDPIGRLTRAAESFSKGDLSSRVSVESTDEVGILSETFNVMAERLQTANEELESRVESRTTDLRRSNQDLEQFAYVASHDLQEPLRMVSSYTQLLSRRYSGQLDDDADEFIGFAVDGAKRMQSLINDLLLYSRAGRQEETFEEIDMNGVLEEVLSNLESRIDSADCTVEFSELPQVVADRRQLVSIFQNLIGNSIKYRAADRASHITISARRLSAACEFAVTDNGIGIDPAFTDRIFTIFQRLHGRDEYQGTGIGLAVVKKIIERAGGSIRVESIPNEGSTFFFTVVDREVSANTENHDERNDLRAAS